MQYQYVFYLFSFGWVMGSVYDVYNTVTTSSKWLRWLRPLLDLCFWCLSGLVVFYLTFVTDNGRFRLYTFALLLVGYLFYRALLHHQVVRSAFAILRLIRGVVHVLVGAFRLVVIQPVVLVLRFLWFFAKPMYRVLSALENLLVAVVIFWLKVLAFPFQPLWQYFGARLYQKFMVKWEGMYADVSKWLRHWPQGDA